MEIKRNNERCKFMCYLNHICNCDGFLNCIYFLASSYKIGGLH
jgi:hypothetical protein